MHMHDIISPVPTTAIKTERTNRIKDSIISMNGDRA